MPSREDRVKGAAGKPITDELLIELMASHGAPEALAVLMSKL